jgi:ankyrin repeat protein
MTSIFQKAGRHIRSDDEVNFKELLQAGLAGETPLMAAAAGQEVAATAFLLSQGANIHARNSNGDQAIHHARSPDLLRLLIQAGADVCSKNKQNYQPIHDTIDLDHIAILLDDGADVNAISGAGSWILDDIAAQGDGPGIAYLSSRGAKPDLTSMGGTYGKTALFSAVGSDSLACVRLLLEAGADINAEDDGVVWTQRDPLA